MFPGNPRNRGNCRLYTAANPATRIALKGDDPDFIVIRIIDSNWDGATVQLPNSAPSGKTFTFFLLFDPITNPVAVTPRVKIAVPGVRQPAGGTVAIFLLGAGQEPRFLYTQDGWLMPRGMGSAGDAGADSLYSSTALAFGEGANAANLGVAIGNGAIGHSSGVAIGVSAIGHTTGVAVGKSAVGNADGVAAGVSAAASSLGVAVGRSAIASTNGVAVGYQANTNSKDAAVALGVNSKAERFRELVKSADGASPMLRSFSILDWYRDTSSATPLEVSLGVGGQLALLLNNSAFIFKLLAVARNNVDDVCKFWEFTGGIKRGANAAATALVGTITKTVVAADAGAATWDVDATADTTTGYLKLMVTGEASKTIRWNIRGDISEVRF